MSGRGVDEGILPDFRHFRFTMLLRPHVRWVARPSVARPASVLVRRIALPVAALITVPHLLAAQSRDSAAASTASAFRCMDTTATITPARLDPRHLIYVEQETVVAQADGRVLVAGSPVFVWRDDIDRHEMLKVDSLFGMVIDSISTAVRAIPSPLPGRSLDGMRAAALPNGWWLVTFAEVDPRRMPKHPIVKRMWAGETDGTRWRDLRMLPVVGDSLDSMQMSNLAWRDGRARLAVQYPREGWTYGALYSLDRGVWSARTENLRLTNYIDFSLSPTHDLMALVRPSEDGPPDVNSLYLFAKRPTDSAWTQKAWVVVGGEHPVHGPMFSGDSVRVLSWLRASENGGRWDVSFATVDAGGDSVGRIHHVSPGAIEAAVASRGSHHVWAIHDRGKPTATLRVVEGDGSPTLASKVTATGYAGLIGVAIARNRVVVVASRPSSDRRAPDVISVIHNHTWRCP